MSSESHYKTTGYVIAGMLVLIIAAVLGNVLGLIGD